MLKIGFIDYYLDEWHANNYPELIKTRSGGEMEVVLAYAEIDSPIGGMTSEEWSKKNNIPLASSIEEVVEKCDRIVVLSPDNPEMHEKLTDIPLKSGKPVYVDKTFATTKSSAIKIFENADSNNTPCFSSSALRFSTELSEVDTDSIDRIYSEGPGDFDTYLIHQLEPIVTLMKTQVKRIMYTGDKNHPAMIIEFSDGRFAQLYQRSDTTGSFKITTVDKENFAKYYEIKSDFFGLFIDGMIKFFKTKKAPVPHQQTIDIMGIIEASKKALEKPFTWIEI